MGTTIVGTVLAKDRMVHFNVGDSRAYRHYPGSLVQISRDDVPHPEVAGPRRVSHVITQCLGGYAWDTGIDPHIATAPPLGPGETLLLCSDGLTDMAGDEEIARVLEAVRDPGGWATNLFELAMDAGGLDNISVVVVRLADDQFGG
jgi:protein phosphatase